MQLFIKFSIFMMIFNSFPLFSQIDKFRSDTFLTDKGKLRIYFIGHGTLMIEFNNIIIHIDPVSMYANYKEMPKADIILITHHHQDHLDINAIDNIIKKDTSIILNQSSYDIIKQGTVIKNGQKLTEKNITIETIRAYNTTKGRDKYHPAGRDNGYILNLGNKNIYVAGDTEDIPEMKKLENKIDIAFLPMNQPYTMTPEQIIEAVKMIKPKILFPYHYGNTNTKELVQLIKKTPYTELRVRDLK